MIKIYDSNQTGLIIPAKFANIDISTITSHEQRQRFVHEKVHAITHLHMKTYIHTFLHPIDKNLFEDFLRKITDNIYRIKGYIRFIGNPDTLLFQYSYGMAMDTTAGLK